MDSRGVKLPTEKEPLQNDAPSPAQMTAGIKKTARERLGAHEARLVAQPRAP